MVEANSLIEEVQKHVRGRDAQDHRKVGAMLALLNQSGVHYTDKQLNLFDDVFNLLVAGLNEAALATVAEQCLEIEQTPPRLLGTLAHHDSAEVAHSVLRAHKALSEQLLIDVASVKSDGHLQAISKREQLSSNITDVLIERGSDTVLSNVISNEGAEFSIEGFAKTADRVSGIEHLMAKLLDREDMQQDVFIKLINLASDKVRKQVAAKSPHKVSLINSAITSASTRLAEGAATHKRDFEGASERLKKKLQSKPELNDMVADLLNERDFDGLILAFSKTLSLSTSCVARLFTDPRPDSTVIIAKASEVPWPLTKQLVKLRGEETKTSFDLEEMAGLHTRLTKNLARAIVTAQNNKGDG